EIARHVCEATTFTTSWNTSAQVGNALLVVFDGAEVHTAAIGTPLSVGPFTSPTKVWWRVFGGGERDYDVPLWKGHPATEGGFSLQDFLAGINAYIDVHGDDWVLAGPSDPNPFVTWNYIRLDGCVTPQEPSVTQFDCAVD